MTSKEARKAALRWAANLLTAQDLDNFVGEFPNEADKKRIRAEVTHIAEHLEWNARGRPERT